MNKKTIRDLQVRGKRVLIRADLNVPLDKQRHVTDDRRIRMFLPTLQDVLDRGGRAIVMSHLGRPSGDPEKDAEFSLLPVAQRMRELLRRDVKFVSDCVGPEAEKSAMALKDGECLLLENLRFHPEETLIDEKKKNPDGKLTPEQDARRLAFGEQLARLGEVYVNDAFGTCHRKHVSMYDVPQRMPVGVRVAGFLVEKELQYLGQALQDPKRPFVAVLGGAKVSDKINVIKSLLGKVDQVLIGGAMSYTFYAAQGKSIGKSLCERDRLDVARELLQIGGDKLRLPQDSVCARELKENAEVQVFSGEIPADMMGLDIGPQTVEAYRKAILNAGTVVWNGPVGAFETRPFDKGTMALAQAMADATASGAVTVIGGGDSAAAIEEAGLAEKVTHVSTGGGASLNFLEGKKFDPIEVLDNK